MRSRHNKSLTLLELLVAITLFSLIVLGFSSIDLFSRYHVITSDRRAKLQNEVSYALEYMTKEISKAIGNVNNPPVTIAHNGWGIIVRIDYDQNGQINDSGDRRIFYMGGLNYQINYYYSYWTGTSWSAWQGPELIADKISFLQYSYNQTNNFIDVYITACWDPDGTPDPCGTPDNPSVTMRTRIKMPSVSTN